MYITPLTKIYSSFKELKEDVDKYGHLFLFDDRKPLEISDLAQGNRNLIVGEPGIGKTVLLKKFKEHHDVLGDKTHHINLRIGNPSKQIDDFLVEVSLSRKVLLLDALDETSSAIFPEVLKKLEEVSRDNPEVLIYLSSRMIFINKYSNYFPEYRFVRIMPFSGDQVKDYLVGLGNKESDVNALLARIMQFSHGKLVVQVPRYLFFLGKFIKDKTISNVSEVSRNELFEYFIYSKLDLEDKNLNTDRKAIIKRILEKLALTMEVYQANTISKDELMTFFDDIESDLKLTVLSHITIDTFFAKTVLQESTQDLDRIEFENTEFQEYLAAKEITRFAKPHRVAFSFAADKNANEILPSWFNTLTFLVDMVPDILEQLLEFSGLRSGEFKIADEGFLNFLGRVNPTSISSDFRRRIFIDVINYHEKTKQWLVGQLASALPSFFTTDFEVELKAHAEKAENETGPSRYIPLGNIAYVVAYLFKEKISLDKPYWRQKLLAYTKDDNDNGVLQRHALYALQTLGDPTVIDELPNLLDSNDELVGRGFLDTCIALNPDHPKSLQYAIQSVKSNDISGRYGLFEIKEKGSILTFLKTYNDDEQFRKEFLDGTSIFGDRDSVLVSSIDSVFDAEIAELCKEVIAKSVQNYIYRSIERSIFVNGLIKLLKSKDSNFIAEILRRIHKVPNGGHGLYFAQDTFAQVFEIEDIPVYMDFMIEVNEKRTAMNTMARIRYSKRDRAEEIYEAGRSKLPKEYTEWEAAQAKGPDPIDNSRKEAILKQFRTQLQPEPGKYITGVFRFYNDHLNDLSPLLTDDDINRFKELITGSVLKFNPAEHGLKILEEHTGGGSKTYTSSEVAHVFGDALISAKNLGIDITPYRSNIALHIPFAYDHELKETFELVKDFTPAELVPVMAIYKEKNTDLWRHQPESFIDLVQRYHLVEAASILKDFVKEQSFRIYTRNEALEVADSLIPDTLFLQEIFDQYINSKKLEEKDIAYVANSLLITSHAKKEAVLWRLEEIKKRATAYITPRSGGVHNVSHIENELRHDKPFAKPLSELKHSGFEDKYLELLDSAIEVWGRGKEFHEYAQYMWEIVYSHFENLKEYRSYGPLKSLEKRVADLKDKDGANWLASSMVRLRRSYLMYLGKPRNFSEAIRKYNEARKFNDKNILNSADLFQHLKDAIETDLRQWIEGEGAYSIIVSEKEYKGNAEYEKLIQKTIKTQLELILMKRDFRVDITREAQLLNDKRTDFTVRYGFVGPIVLEIKLSSHSDIKASKVEETESYESMCKYMDGYGALHGIFLIIDNTGTKHLNRAKEAFGKIPNVWAISLDCYKFAVKNNVTKSKGGKAKKTKKRPKSSKRITR